MPPIAVDLSNNNREPDWRRLHHEGVEAVWLKASEGHDFADHTYAGRAERARTVGLRVGAYHFARPNDSTPELQADWFAQIAGKPARRDLRPVLDYEVTRSGGGDQAWIEQFNRQARARLGVGLLFYSNPFTIGQLHLTRPVGFGLWLADYTTSVPPAPSPWRHYVAWQFTDHGSFGGVSPVDVSRITGLRGVLAHPLLGLV